MSSTLAVDAALRRTPPSWTVHRFSRILKRKDARRGESAAQLLSLSSQGHLYERNQETDRQKAADENLQRCLLVRPGDLVVNPMWLTGGSIAVSDRAGAVSPDYRVFTPAPGVHPRYLHHLLRSDPYRDQYQLFVRAETTFDRRVQQGDLDVLPLAMPPIEVQQRIADFLDDQVARIDQVSSLRLQQIALERAAFLSWLDGMVAALPRVPLRRQMVSVTSGPRGWGDLVDDAGSRMFIRINNISGLGIEPNLDGVAWVHPPDDAEAARAQLTTGDLLVSITASIGDVALAGPELEGAAFSQHVARVRLVQPQAARALAWAASASSSREALINSAAGGTKMGLSLQQVADWSVPLCAEDAAGFAQACDDRYETSTQILKAMERAVSRIGEYKRSLITAAVTGQLDVTTASQGVPA